MTEQKNDPERTGATEFKPGETILTRTEASTPEAAKAEPVTSAEPMPVDATPVYQPQPDDREFYVPENQVLEGEVAAPDQPAITWTASEFIAHSKSPLWYISLTVLVVAVAAVIFLLTHDVISTVVIVLAGLALGIYGARQPRQLRYALSANGLLIANRYFSFEDFRSFAILDEGAVNSIVFTPLRRFGQLLTIYYDPADEERIVNLLANRLPMEHRTHDAIDRFMRRIHF